MRFVAKSKEWTVALHSVCLWGNKILNVLVESPLRGTANRKRESSSWPPSSVLKWGDCFLEANCKWEITFLASKKPQFTSSVILPLHRRQPCVCVVHRPVHYPLITARIFTALIPVSTKLLYSSVYLVLSDGRQAIGFSRRKACILASHKQACVKGETHTLSFHHTATGDNSDMLSPSPTRPLRVGPSCRFWFLHPP